MTDDGANGLFLVLCLILPISALVARRLPLKDSAKMALAWVAIFGVLFLIVALWQEAMGAGMALGGLFQG